MTGDSGGIHTDPAHANKLRLHAISAETFAADSANAQRGADCSLIEKPHRPTPLSLVLQQALELSDHETVPAPISLKMMKSSARERVNVSED